MLSCIAAFPQLPPHDRKGEQLFNMYMTLRIYAYYNRLLTQCGMTFTHLRCLNYILQCCTFLDSRALDPGDETIQTRDRREIMTWDDALRKSTQEYQHQSYNILTCNCHCYVANCLNRLKFQAGDWNVVNLAILIFIRGQFVSRLAILRTYLPFVLVLCVGLAFGGDVFLCYLAIFAFVLVGWFVTGTYFFKKLIYV